MKGNLYYLIVEAWLQKVLSVMTNMHREIQWSSIRGYNELLLSFAEQLEKVPLNRYNEAMTKVMRTFLSNENTLSLFVSVLIKKTHSYSIQEVSDVLELIDSLFCGSYRSFSLTGSYRRWMDRLERSRHPNTTVTAMKLPSTFSEYPLIDGIITLLHSDMNQVVIKTLELLYHHWDLFRSAQRHAFYVELMSDDLMVNLFLHWNVHVRQFFDYLLVYQLLQVSIRDKKNRVDVYSFLKEFSKGGFSPALLHLAHVQKPYRIKLSNVEKLQFFMKKSVIARNYCSISELEVTSLLRGRDDYQDFCESLDVFSMTDFVRVCWTCHRVEGLLQERVERLLGRQLQRVDRLLPAAGARVPRDGRREGDVSVLLVAET